MIFVLLLQLAAQDRPVLRLDEALIQGNVRKPKLIEIKASQLDELVQQAALRNLVQLEARLLQPSPRSDDSNQVKK